MGRKAVNRKERRALVREQHEHVKSFPAKLTPIPESELLPAFAQMSSHPVAAWVSRDYHVQLWDEGEGKLRLSVCRSRLGKQSWEDKLTWDELMQIKREVGYGDWYGVEVYPRDRDIVNVANFRHIWLFPTPLKIGWFKK